MLDSIPRRISIEYWLKRKCWAIASYIRRHQDRAIIASFLLLSITIGSLYNPVYSYLSGQETRVTIHVSEFTVFFIFFLFFWAHFTNQILNRFTKGKRYIWRFTGLCLSIAIMMAILDLSGMTMRWD